MTMPSDEQIEEMLEGTISIMTFAGEQTLMYQHETIRDRLSKILSSAVEEEKQKWVGICSYLRDCYLIEGRKEAYIAAEEIKRRGLE